MHHGEFEDPALTAIYDAENSWSTDDAFVRTHLATIPGSRVLDLGCGTGRLALGLAASGHAVTGVEPARASLDAARAKPGSERVQWLERSAADLPIGAFDVALMTSHVAQFIVPDAAWIETLNAVHSALLPNGLLLFDSCDPASRIWERWNAVESRRSVELDNGNRVEVWTEATGLEDGVVRFVHHYRFDNGVHRTSTAAMRFRSEQALRTTLARCGFSVEHVYGGWRREPTGQGGDDLVILARA